MIFDILFYSPPSPRPPQPLPAATAAARQLPRVAWGNQPPNDLGDAAVGLLRPQPSSRPATPAHSNASGGRRPYLGITTALSGATAVGEPVGNTRSASLQRAGVTALCSRCLGAGVAVRQPRILDCGFGVYRHQKPAGSPAQPSASTP